MSSGAEHTLRALRERVAAIEGGKRTGRVLPFGDGRVDGNLPGGGLPLGRWHELAGEGMELETAAAPAAWSALVGSRLAADGEGVWILQREDLHPPGLAALGLRPIFVLVRNDVEALAAAEDALRTKGVAAVWAEAAELDLTAGRRLQLACETHGATAFLLRRRLWAGARAETSTGSATRWRVAAAPSDPGEAPGLGPARWRVTLERAQGGRPGAWLMEADDDQADRIRVVSELAADGVAAAEPLRRAG